MGTQAKLLRVLEDSRVRRLGGRVEKQVDVQIIAATNREPQQAVDDNQLRMDLFYRLNVFQIHLPALRDRREDLPLLTEALLGPLNEKYGCRVTDIAQGVLAAFERHPWPGNVRELRNVLSRGVIMAGEGTIELRHLPPQFLLPTSPPQTPVATAENGIFLKTGTTVRDAEQVLIEHTLEFAGNNKTRAAAILGIGLKTLHSKLKLYKEEE